jgi:hypothetical protein
MATDPKKALSTANLTDAERATWEMPIATAQALGLMASDDPDIEESAADRVSAMLGAALDDEKAFVKVQRIIGPNKYAHCDEYSIADYEQGGVRMIREQWGPGEYDVRLYGVKPESGKFGVRAKAMITILAKQGESVTANPTRATSELSQVLQTIAQGQQQMLAALTERPSAPDPMSQMQTMLSMMGAMREAMGANNPQQNQLKDIVSAMREMKEVSAEFAPKETPDADNPMTMLPGILETVRAFAGQQRGAPMSAPTMPAVALPSMSHQPTAPSAPTTEGNENVDIPALALLGHLRRLVTMAQTNVDPQVGADLIYEKLPDEFIDLMAADEWFTMLEQVAPAVSAHKEWVTKARDLAMAQFATDDAEQVALDADSNNQALPMP